MKAPIVIMDASKQPYLSIGVRYGGVKVYGYEYCYHIIKDAYVRHDYLKYLRKMNWENFLEFIKDK